MERIFPYIGVRFISVNDNYDSDMIANKMPGIDSPNRRMEKAGLIKFEENYSKGW